MLLTSTHADTYDTEQPALQGRLHPLLGHGGCQRANITKDQYEHIVEALDGNSKAWQGRWGEYSTAVTALRDRLDEQLTLYAADTNSFWYGTGWKDFSPLPVLIMPAAASLASVGCDTTLLSCQQQVLASEGRYKAKLLLAY